LCSILTQETWKDRILGKTGMATVPTCTTWLATGNNLLIVGDLSTRALVCDLDAKVEHPEERKFDINLYEYVPAHRDELVPAALTCCERTTSLADRTWARPLRPVRGLEQLATRGARLGGRSGSVRHAQAYRGCRSGAPHAPDGAGLLDAHHRAGPGDGRRGRADGAVVCRHGHARAARAAAGDHGQQRGE
jgi:hypothetical protein